MPKIRVVALGGLDENGKNLYCLEINNKIIVLDAGLKYPDNIVFSVHSFIPNFNYLVENKDKIIAIFLSHGHIDNCGAIPFIAQQLPEVNIYASEYTQLVINDRIKKLNSDIKPKFQKLTEGVLLKDKELEISAFAMTHTSPDIYSFAIKTEAGYIYYATDFVFDNSMNKGSKFNFGNILRTIGDKTLLLMNESINAGTPGLTSPKHLVTPIIESPIYNHQKRIVIATYDDQVSYIKEVLEIAKTNNRAVIIESEKLSNVIQLCIDNGYINDTDMNIIYSHEDKNVENPIIILGRGPESIFREINDLGAGMHEWIKLNKEDLVICLAIAMPGNELSANEAFDSLAKANARVMPLSRKILAAPHCSFEDIKTMNYLIRPKFFMPIKGLYKHLAQAKKAAIESGIDEKNIILAENGEFYSYNGTTFTKEANAIDTAATLVSNSNLETIESNSLDEKLKLSENGVIITAFGINKTTKVITTNIDTQMRGVVFIKDNMHILDEISNICRESVKQYYAKNLSDYKQLERTTSFLINKHIQKTLKKDPLVLVVIDFNNL